jgi:hypothetical protein
MHAAELVGRLRDCTPQVKQLWHPIWRDKRVCLKLPLRLNCNKIDLVTCGTIRLCKVFSCLHICALACLSQVAPSHLISVRLINGAGALCDQQTGETFIPHGNNFVRLASQSNLNGGLWCTIPLSTPATTIALTLSQI